MKDLPLSTYTRAVFGWEEEVSVSPGPRGALGQIWRLDVGPKRYALKEIFAEPPSPESIEAELAFTVRAAEAGVRLPMSHPDREGRYLVTTPDGKWLRLYDWIDMLPVTPNAVAEKLGVLFARMHRCAPAATSEPSAWYSRVPDPAEWAGLSGLDDARAARLTDRLSTLPQLCAAVKPADPATLIVCHRDLHPANVLADPEGELVVVDWDNFGPADPSRELAQALFDWFCFGPEVDLDAMCVMYEAYVREGGAGRVTELADFSMLLAVRLNFLLVQARVATDPQAEQRHREWALREIDEMLPDLPTLSQLTRALEQIRSL